MTSEYDTIYLSPHLDDVTLSCGGQVYMQSAAGQPVLLVTVMAGDPASSDSSTFVQALHERWDLEADAAAARREEDIQACTILGADYLHWEFPDCIYRVHPATGEPLYLSNQSLFDKVDTSETILTDRIADQIRGLPPHKLLVMPLGVGNHVDHQLTRRAAESAGPERISYYEEIPYVFIPGAVEALIAREDPSWQPQTIPLTPEAMQAKVAAIAAYRSQITTFFRDHDDMEKTIRAYADTLGGERIWRRAGDD